MNNPQMQGGTPIQCPQCGAQFAAHLESIIEAGYDPAAKARFLSRRTNVVQCPNCQTVMQLTVPLVYHDHTKDLLMIYFPQEVNLPQAERERIVGEMSKAVMESVPQEERKGYMLNPIMPLTLDGMIEGILEKDGITPEMRQQQQDKMNFVQRFLEVDDDGLEALVEAHDAEIDDEFFQMITLSAEAALSTGNQQVAEMILQRRNTIIQLSSAGQDALERAQEQEAAIQEVTAFLQTNNNQLTTDTFIDYLVEIGESDNHVQAVAGLARPVLDYNFFLALSERADKASSQDEKDYIVSIRERLSELVQMLDDQQQQVVGQAQQILGDILNAEDMETAIEQRLPYIDELFLQVLDASLQHAQQQGDLINATRLKNAREAIIGALQASSPPEVRFVTQLLEQDDPIEARLMLSEQAVDYGQPLVDYLDALIENLAQRGGDADLTATLQEYRAAAANAIGG